MRWGQGWSAAGAAARILLLLPLIALALAGCNTTGPQSAASLTSPEAAGILRILPVSAVLPETTAKQDPAQDDVPLPPHRPGLARTAALAAIAARNE